MRFDKNSFETIVYTKQQGIPADEFNTFSHFQDTNGNLYFGGVGGVIKFHPKNLLNSSDYNAPFKISGVKILEKEAKIFTDRTEQFEREKNHSTNA